MNFLKCLHNSNTHTRIQDYFVGKAVCFSRPVSMHCGPPYNHHQAHTDLVYGCQFLATFIGLLNSEFWRTKLFEDLPVLLLSMLLGNRFHDHFWRSALHIEHFLGRWFLFTLILLIKPKFRLVDLSWFIAPWLYVVLVGKKIRFLDESCIFQNLFLPLLMSVFKPIKFHEHRLAYGYFCYIFWLFLRWKII
jgi:hypothetical protein